MSATTSHAMPLDTACASRFAEGAAFSDQTQTDCRVNKRSRPFQRVAHWCPGMGLAGDSADLPAAKRATLASISLLYQSLEAATWKCIADLKRRDEEERQESRVIAELHPLKWVKRERMAATNLTSPRASPSSVGSPPEENAPAVPKTKTWLATPQLAPLVRPVLSFEEATAKAAKLDISQSISTPTPDAEYYKAEDMSELSI